VLRHHVRAAIRVAPGRPALWIGLRVAAALGVPLLLSPWLDPVIVRWASSSLHGATSHWFFASSGTAASGTNTPKFGIVKV